MKLYPERSCTPNGIALGGWEWMAGRGSSPLKNSEPLSGNMRWGTIAVCQMQCVADADLVTNGNNSINTTNSISRRKSGGSCCGKPINTETDCEGFNTEIQLTTIPISSLGGRDQQGSVFGSRCVSKVPSHINVFPYILVLSCISVVIIWIVQKHRQTPNTERR